MSEGVRDCKKFGNHCCMVSIAMVSVVADPPVVVVTSGAPATSTRRVPCRSFSSRQEYWMLCTCVKLARWVGWRHQRTEGVNAQSAVCKAYINRNTRTHSHTHTCTHTHTHAYVHTYAHAHTPVHAHTH